MSDLKDRLRAIYKRMSLREKLLSLLFVLHTLNMVEQLAQPLV